MDGDPLTDELGTGLETEAGDPLQVEVFAGTYGVTGWLSLVPALRGTPVLCAAIDGALGLGPAVGGTLMLDHKGATR